MFCTMYHKFWMLEKWIAPSFPYFLQLLFNLMCYINTFMHVKLQDEAYETN